jgi:hypothetical protein
MGLVQISFFLRRAITSQILFFVTISKRRRWHVALSLSFAFLPRKRINCRICPKRAEFTILPHSVYLYYIQSKDYRINLFVFLSSKTKTQNKMLLTPQSIERLQRCKHKLTYSLSARSDFFR